MQSKIEYKSNSEYLNIYKQRNKNERDLDGNILGDNKSIRFKVRQWKIIIAFRIN